MKKVLVTILKTKIKKAAFKRVQSELGFKVLSCKQDTVNKDGLPHPEGFGQNILTYEVELSDFQYAVFHGTAMNMEHDEAQQRFARSWKAYRRENVTEQLEERLQTDEDYFRQNLLAGWLLSALIGALTINEDLLERFVAVKMVEDKRQCGPQAVIDSGVFKIELKE